MSSDAVNRPTVGPAGSTFYSRQKLPLSPHLQVWRFTVTMAASITHRGTGIALYSGTLLLAIWAVTVSIGVDAFRPVGAFLTSPFGIFVLFGYCWALLFHLMNGLRHLYWDSGRSLAPKTATMTAWLIYGASLVLTVALLFAGLAARGAI